MLDITGLNPPQQDAVLHYQGPCLILAGAGTGKTRVITFRVANMIAGGIDPASIVALSFTNKAAREMKERAAALVGPRIKSAFLGTFHSFCLQILRRYHKEIGLTQRFGLADTSDQLDFVRRALGEKNWQDVYRAETLHYQIGQCKNRLIRPEEVTERTAPGVDDPVILGEIYGLYERHLRLNQVIDFDDCIFKVVRLFDDYPGIVEELSRQFRYLLVDEFQDTNLAQLKIIELLAADHRNACVVGDDDQSIYSWRGAMYETLQRFEEIFPETKLIKLEQNYRCTSVILDAANTVIRNNPSRKDKTLWSDKQAKEPIQLLAHHTDRDEAKWCAEKIMGLMGSGRLPKDIAILYRANNQARNFEMALREFNIPYRTFGGQSFFERKEVKDFVAYLRLILNPSDRMAFHRAITSPPRGVGTKTLEHIEGHSRAKKQSPLRFLSGEHDLDGPAGRAALAFRDMIHELAAMPRTAPEDYKELASAILKRSGIRDDIRKRTKNAAAKERKLEVLGTLPDWLLQLTTTVLEEHKKIETAAVLDTVTLDNDAGKTEEERGNTVSLMTIHASKGLEFPAVFVVGIEEDCLPHKMSCETPQGIHEERRLFYVAVTRAKSQLFLSYAHEKTVAGSLRPRTMSRFLKEIPEECLSESSRQETVKTISDAKEERKGQTLSQLSELRSWLSTTK